MALSFRDGLQEREESVKLLTAMIPEAGILCHPCFTACPQITDSSTEHRDCNDSIPTLLINSVGVSYRIPEYDVAIELALLNVLLSRGDAYDQTRLYTKAREVQGAQDRLTISRFYRSY